MHGWQVEAQTASRPKPKKQGDWLMDTKYHSCRLVYKHNPNVFENLDSQVYSEALEKALEKLGWMFVVEVDED